MGQEGCASLWSCYGVLRIKEKKKKVFEELQMLCESCQAENPGSCSNSSSEKLLFSLPFLFEG